MSSKSGARPWSLAARLTLWYAGSAFLLVLVATGYLYWALVRQLDREDDQFLADKVAAVRAVLDARPGDGAALKREVGEGPAGGDAGRTLVRVADGRGEPVRAETPGMGEAIPPFGGAVPAEYTAGNGRSYRLRGYRDEAGRVEVLAAMDRTHEGELLEGYRRNLSYVLGLSLLACAVGGYRIARGGVRPVEAVTETARRIRPAHLGERLRLDGLPTELLDLAGTFNAMLDRLEDAFGRLSRFSADIAHELRTPVCNLRGEAEVALGRPRTADEYREVLGSSLEECGRLTRLIDTLLFLAKAEDPKTELTTEPVDVGRELAGVREFFEPAAAEAGVRLAVEAEDGLTLRADRTLFQRAVGNLVTNAIAHTPAGGAVVVRAVSASPSVVVEVEDTGPGVTPEHLPYLFDRFYRADPGRSSNGNRVGLGLAIVKAVTELHGGTVSVKCLPGKGATFVLRFPGQ